MRLKEARLRAGLNQTQLAERLGVSQVSVCNWEQGTVQPHPSTRRKIDEILGIEISYPDERPLTANEQREMFDAICIAAQHLGYARALAIFTDKNADEIRELTELALSSNEKALLPPGVEIKRTQ